MKNIYEVILQKKAEFERLKRELEALRTVAPLLEEELSVEVQAMPQPVWTEPTGQDKLVAAAPDTGPILPRNDAEHDGNLVHQPVPAARIPIITGVVTRSHDLAPVVRNVINTCS